MSFALEVNKFLPCHKQHLRSSLSSHTNYLHYSMAEYFCWVFFCSIFSVICKLCDGKFASGEKKKQRVSLTWWECRWRIWLKLIFIATLLPSILIQYIHIFLLTIIVFESSSEINLHRQRCSFTYVINVNREREKKAEWESSEGSFLLFSSEKCWWWHHF